MVWPLRLSGAEVRCVDCHAGEVALYLGPGEGRSNGDLAAGVLFRAASWKGEPERCRGVIQEGWVYASGRRHTILSRSLEACGPISAHLVFDTGEILRITAGAMDLLLPGDGAAPRILGGAPC